MVKPGILAYFRPDATGNILLLDKKNYFYRKVFALLCKIPIFTPKLCKFNQNFQ